MGVHGEGAMFRQLHTPCFPIILFSLSFVVVSINFDPTSYSVTEGDTATLMLVLSSPSDSPVTVQVLTNPGSALGMMDTVVVR